MKSVILAHQADLAGWRRAARALAMAGIPPEQVVWSVREAADLFAEAGDPPPANGTFHVSRALVDLAEEALLASDPQRFAWTYALVWRAQHGERRLLEDAADPGVIRVQRLAQSVRRDMHKMRAFLRFREVAENGATRHVGWFEPEHFIVEANAPFFVRRFATMAWSILTPYRSAHWDGERLLMGPGASRADVPDDDALETYWRAYFSAIFNPARVKIGAMLSEMPKKYWRNLPEAAAIPDLVRQAAARTQSMVETPVITPPRPRKPRAPATPSPPAGATQLTGRLAALAEDAAGCRRCTLWANATQTVFGEGPADATIMLVGEQPGDQEDLAGRPFVGPAGQVLDRAIAEAGIDRRTLYITNAVKHFKFEPRGKRRIHAKPDTTEIVACGAWLAQEREIVRPKLMILLGATAARAVLGRTVTISHERSRPMALSDGTQAMVTVHPSYLLRLPDEESRLREYAAFVRDLRAAHALMAQEA